MKKTRSANLKRPSRHWLDEATFWLPVALLFMVPLVFSTSVRTVYALPKFVVLLVGSALLLLVLARRMAAAAPAGPALAPLLKSTPLRFVYLYFACVALSTLFGVASLVSLFGSASNFMGLLTAFCFFICFLGLIVGINASQLRLRQVLWAITATGGLVALYAVLQFFNFEPFASRSLYTFTSPAGQVIRVCSSLGHSNYLGNFLLYVTPLAAALACASNGRARWLAGLITMLGLAAIIFSVARGAWVGLIVGAAVFAVFELKGAAARLAANRRRAVIVMIIIFVAVALAAGLIAISPAARSIGERVQALRREGLGSSGRVLLWRDSLKMVPAYGLVGCGPEGFRKAFLAYKSKELAQLAPKASNESPHNAYLEAALAYGLPGAVFYFAIIVSTLRLMARARQRAPSLQWRITLTGLIAAYAAVLTHDLFIFNQITTGLYFFAFAAFAIAAAHCFSESPLQPAARAAGVEGQAAAGLQADANPSSRRRISSLALTAFAGLSVVFAIWYAVGLIEADVDFKKLLNPAIGNDFQALAQQSERATNSPLPTHAYDLPVAYVLETYARRLATQINAKTAAPADVSNLTQTRMDALRLAMQYAEKSLNYTNTPDAGYTTLASIALAAGDIDKLNFAASEAVKRDPTNYQARWLLAEGYLARGDRDSAAREAEASLDLYHVSPEAASALARARGEQATEAAVAKILAESRNQHVRAKRSPEDLIAAARRLAEAGKLNRARIKLLTAARRADGSCPDCHRELALVYEKLNRFADAITEWQTYTVQAPERAAAEQVAARIETLKKKSNPAS